MDGSVNKNPVVSRREYSRRRFHRRREKGPCPHIADGIAGLPAAFTPVLGRRSCPIARPLLDGGPVEAIDAKSLLAKVTPIGGVIYAEGELVSEQPMQIRDVPMYGRHRQFGTRRVYVHKE